MVTRSQSIHEHVSWLALALSLCLAVVFEGASSAHFSLSGNVDANVSATESLRDRVVVVLESFKGSKTVSYKQRQALKQTGLMDIAEKVVILTNSRGMPDPYRRAQDPKEMHILLDDTSSKAFASIKVLYDVCQTYPKAKILHMHDGWSLSTGRDTYRLGLECFVMSRYCLEVLDKFDTCGLRLGLEPFVHYYGDFYWATCPYINTLIDPRRLESDRSLRKATVDLFARKGLGRSQTPQNNVPEITQMVIQAESRLSTSTTTNTETGEDDGAAEGESGDMEALQDMLYESSLIASAWLGSGPTIRPADALNATIAPTYVGGVVLPPDELKQYCSKIGHKARYLGDGDIDGTQCSASAVGGVRAANSVQSVGDADSPLRAALTRNKEGVVDMISKLSDLWYGTKPVSVLNWVSRNAVDSQLVQQLQQSSPLSSYMYCAKQDRKMTSTQMLPQAYDNFFPQHYLSAEVGKASLAPPTLKMYMMFYGEASNEAVSGFTKSQGLPVDHTRDANQWLRPLEITPSEFEESLVFRETLIHLYEEWQQSDYVGTLLRVHNLAGNVPQILQAAHNKGYDVVPFQLNKGPLMKQAVAKYSVQFTKAWNALMFSLGHDGDDLLRCSESAPFYHSTWAARPDWMRLYIQYVSRAIEMVMFNHDVRRAMLGHQYTPGALSDAVGERGLMKLSKSKKGSKSKSHSLDYPTLVHAIFERLPGHFFCIHRANVCNDDADVCPYVSIDEHSKQGQHPNVRHPGMARSSGRHAMRPMVPEHASNGS